MMLAGSLTIIAWHNETKSTGYHPKPVTLNFSTLNYLKRHIVPHCKGIITPKKLKVGGEVAAYYCEKYAVVHIKTDTISRTNAILAVSSFDLTVKRGREQATITVPRGVYIRYYIFYQFWYVKHRIIII